MLSTLVLSNENRLLIMRGSPHLYRWGRMSRFVNNEIPIFGLYYKDFEDKPRMRHTLRFNVNDLKSEKEVLQWYVDMNAGGTPHTSEEIDRVKAMIKQIESEE